MTREEMKALPAAEWLALPGEARRNCADCGHLFSAVNWWCGSDEAIEARGTSIPGVSFCDYWKPEEG